MKTMLRRYEALGGAVVLLLSKRVAGLLSMVFCAKVTKPPGAGGHRNGKPSLEHVQRRGRHTEEVGVGAAGWQARAGRWGGRSGTTPTGR